jgi:DNA topoisomerase-1
VASDTDVLADGDGRRRLVIVESPAKARTIAGYLGPDYVVESSIGHIRDLPGGAGDMPPEQKHLWKTYGIDVDHDFAPVYVINADKRQQVAKLRSALKNVDELLLATDEDREGEAIAWHLLEVLKPRVPVRRMVFHEITPAAIRDAVANPREIDRALVDAQETRRIVDRLYGYGVSPVLWKKIMPRLSAGRVQSVATRLLVERERARIRFRSAEYWDLAGTFDTVTSGAESPNSDAAAPGDPTTFTAGLVSVDGRRIASGRDFGEDGQLTRDVVHLREDDAVGLAAQLETSEFTVRGVEERPYRRSPYPPFMTSTLQQEGSRKLRLTARLVMSLAQRLYENGYITYMRTDSTTLSETALAAARRQAGELYGADYVPEAPRRYERKVKNAQEAHEAIRPAGDSFRTPASVRGELGSDEYRLYELIWQRTVASQMADAVGRSVTVRVGGISSAGEDAEFSVSGKVITFPGFLRAYVEETEDESGERDDRETRLPHVETDQPLRAIGIEPQSHATSPPARYTEASLVKALEELGIGRPSTYASILGTIQDRGYVFKRGTALVPSFTAFAVVGLLEQHFGRLVDYGFTASMEDDLDAIANGTEQSAAWLGRFYFGDETSTEADPHGLKQLVTDRLGEIDAREVNSLPIGLAEDGELVVARVGRYGPYVQKGDLRASIPDDLPPDELTVERAVGLLEKTSDERLLGQHPDTGEPVLVRSGRYGPYITTQPLEEGEVKTASLFTDMSVADVTLDQAVRLLSLPRSLGIDPANGEDVTAQNGRYGPYVRRGTESRSLETEAALFTVTLDEALALLAQPKSRGRRAAAAPAREIGADPASGKPMVVREGRFGPYVTDGETNASLRKGDSIEELTVDRAAELLAERRARGPATPKKRASARRTASTAKKTAAKKSTAKKTTARKSVAKKTTAKKTTAKRGAAKPSS